ncbi:DedA family protein [Luteolibacter pohnpeiensis]|uniref:DedA family protein n=1 Tax=Luteolibacter pohnpeiensis TaxID=454153 RepID=A0A934S2B7_9BACT|nr:YqaA family protein [Luteolibacter pohnpeiensis]MBK1881042.1 DedA family protein [Luteolibacter pohnpeiensis]
MTTAVASNPGPIRRLYNWTISWADHPAGTWALFLIAFAESSFFPIPPDVLLIALCFGARQKWMKYATVCTIGSVLGAAAGWFIGWGFWATVHHWFIPHLFTQAQFDKVGGMYASNAFLAVFAAAFTPIPFKVFTIAAGVFHVSIPVLLLGSLVGRAGRFFIVAGLIRIFGPTVKPFIEKHLEWCFLIGGLLLIAGFVLIKFLH